LPGDIKTQVERGAMNEILNGVPFAADWMALWEELHAAETAVSRLVHDADKLDMFLQAVIYEEQTGNRHLAEFWQRPYQFYFPQAQEIYEALRSRRMNG
jgi:5'-deoxynucleotidase YfbR-like HD superfamily hydrolase